MTVQFLLTDAGRQAILDVEDLGVDLKLKELAVSTHKYDEEDLTSLTELEDQLGTFLLGGGQVETVSKTLRLTAYIEPTFTAMIYTVGLVTAEGVLFAVASTTGTVPILQLVTNITCIATFGLVVVDVDLGSVTIMMDPQTPLGIALMNQHIAHPNPHPQYAMLAAFQQLLQTVESLTEELMATQFELLTEQIDLLKTRVTDLENASPLTINFIYPIGCVIDFGIAEFDPNTHYVGTTWVRHGEGKASVGLSVQAGDPTWTKAVGNTYGEYEHQLTVGQLPKFKIEVGNYSGVLGTENGAALQHGSEPYEEEGEVSSKFSAEIGNDEAFSIVQKSIVDARWRRTA